MQTGTAIACTLRIAAAAHRQRCFTGSKSALEAFSIKNSNFSRSNGGERATSVVANELIKTPGVFRFPADPTVAVPAQFGLPAAALRGIRGPQCLKVSALLKACFSSSSSSSAATAAPIRGADTELLVTREAPNFIADAVLPNGKIRFIGELGKISLEEFRKEGKGVVLLFYPLDFTFVCPSELLAFHHAAAEFEKLHFQVVGISVDSVYTHLAWTRTPPAEGGVGRLSFPLVSDLKREISTNYHVLLGGAGVAVRGLFVIDKDGVIRHSTVNDLPLGRSVDEALRVCEMVHALDEQKGAAGEGGRSMLQQVCPANWRRGQKMMQATYEGVKEYLSDKERELKQKAREKL